MLMLQFQLSDAEKKEAAVNSAKVDVEHKYVLLAVELQRFHVELHKLLGVVKEFQEQLATFGDDGELTAAVVDKYAKDIHRLVSELDERNLDVIDHSDADGETLLQAAAAALALRRENDSLQRRIDQVQAEKEDLEKQLIRVEELVTLARELRDENEGLINDFRIFKDNIAAEQENDTLEIVELTKSFKELIADNEILRHNSVRLNSMIRQLQPPDDDVYRRFKSSREGQGHADAGEDCRQVLNRSLSWPVFAECNQAASGRKVHKEDAQVEVGYRLVKSWKMNALDTNKETRTETDNMEDKQTCSVVSEVDTRRQSDEITRRRENDGRMDCTASETIHSDTTSATEAVREGTCPFAEPSVEHREMVVSQQTLPPIDVTQSTGTMSDHDRPDTERHRCNAAKLNARSEELPLPGRETNPTGEWMSTDSDASRVCSLERDRDDSSLANSDPERSVNSPSDHANIELSIAWQQLLGENRRPRNELAKPSEEPPSMRTSDKFKDDKIAELRYHASQLYLLSSGVHLDDGDNELPWAQPYDDSAPVTDTDGKDSNNGCEDGNIDKWSLEILRRQNVLLNQELETVKLKLDKNDTSADETMNQLRDEAVGFRDQQTTLLDELAVQMKEIENVEEVSRTVTLHSSADDVPDSYWSLFDEVDSRRTRLNDDDSDFASRNRNGERTIQVFGRRLREWLNDYETLINERNTQHQNGSYFCLGRIPEVQQMITCKQDCQSLLTDANGQLESLEHDMADLQTPLEHTQLAVNALATRLEQRATKPTKQERDINTSDGDESPTERTHLTVDALTTDLDLLKTELNAKQEELRRRREVDDKLRIENEALRAAASSSSPTVASDYEEHLVAEIERLMFDRSLLQQSLQEARYEAEELREELAGENDRLRRQLKALTRRAEDERSSAAENAELLTAEIRRLRDRLSELEADFRAAEESHAARQAESADRLRTVEEQRTTENDRLHGELSAAEAERCRLRDKCVKLENDCVAFQELSNDMMKRCDQLGIELERSRRSAGGNASASHEDCRRVAELARREIRALRDENSRLMVILEMERLKNFADEPATMIDSQTDTADLELPGVLPPTSGIESEQPSRSVDVRGEGDGGTEEKDDQMLLLFRHARAARDAALQLRHLLNNDADCEQSQNSGGTVDGTKVADATVSTNQMADVVDKLVLELDVVVKSLATRDSERTVNGLSDGHRNGNSCIAFMSASSNQLREFTAVTAGKIPQILRCRQFFLFTPTVNDKRLVFNYTAR